MRLYADYDGYRGALLHGWRSRYNGIRMRGKVEKDVTKVGYELRGSGFRGGHGEEVAIHRAEARDF